VASVLRQHQVKKNGLAGNTPAKVPLGTVTAPARTAAKPAPVQLDNMAKKVAGWFGNTEDEIREMLK
jgi:hypothetical protein